MDPSTLVIAIVYALSTGVAGAPLGARLGPGEPVPAEARGVLLPDHGVAQLADGAALRTADRPGELRLDAGAVRLVAANGLAVTTANVRAMLGEAAEATVSRERGRDVVCAVRGDVVVEVLASRRAGGLAGDAGGDSGATSIPAGTCWSRGQAPDAVAFDPSRADAIRRGAQGAPPPPLEVPDVLGDLSAQLAEVEDAWGEQLDQGPRREASSCGCSENGGSGGGLDPGGSSQPDPDPERPDPGRIRIRIQIPGGH